MDRSRLIGQIVQHTGTRQIGTISYIRDGVVCVDFHGIKNRLKYPDAFSGTLILEDEDLLDEIMGEAEEAAFDVFKRQYRLCVQQEVATLKSTGGKHYTALGGSLLQSNGSAYLYTFDTDAELHLMDGTRLRIYSGGRQIGFATLVSCEDYAITIRTSESLGSNLEHIEFSSDSWQLLEALYERIDEMHANRESIAYALACKGRHQINLMDSMRLGQDTAIDHALNEPITFIWGPPGTGKTHTLSRIACEYIMSGKRVLMLSFSNVSVDGAMLRVYNTVQSPVGRVIRYGYPRTEEILNSRTMTSYQYVLYKNPDMAERYYALMEERRRLKKKDPRRVDLNKEIQRIRDGLREQEHQLVQSVPFVATTISKALCDAAIYSQRFDMVIFDEASMAYVPQIVFAGSLASQRFCCMGDFNQLPAIVQSNDNPRLEEDIFEYAGVTDAVEQNCGHNWLVMLNRQFRMHPDIAEFVSDNMYHSLLYSGDEMLAQRADIAAVGPIVASAMNMLDLSGTYSVCCKTGDGSRINLLSAMISVMMAEELAAQYQVGIITPYNAQSRLILSMVRDIREQHPELSEITCATVHQFQGSEKAVIIYDAVDCYRMPYPGTLLTSKKHGTANRLFNVAMTRAQGKFIMMINADYFRRKNLSSTLLFAQAQEEMRMTGDCISADDLVDSWIQYTHQEDSLFYIDHEEQEWQQYLADIESAGSRIRVMIPGAMRDDNGEINALAEALGRAAARGVNVRILADQDILLPEELEQFTEYRPYISVPVTILDKQIIWYGQPVCDEDFISEGNVIPTQRQIYIRFDGVIAARSIGSFLNI